jgi:hypothetical protein
MPERWPTNDHTWRAFFPYRTDQERQQGVRFGLFANALGNGRFLRGAAGQADVSRMMLRHLQSIRLSRAELHLCLLC